MPINNKNNINNNVCVYILKLKNNKYYIGKSENVLHRIDDHKRSKGCKWTSLHKYLSVEKIIPNCDSYDEDKYTKLYMSEYGIDNVRGGSYTQIELTDQVKEQLLKELSVINNRYHFYKITVPLADRINDFNDHNLYVVKLKDNQYYIGLDNSELNTSQQILVNDLVSVYEPESIEKIIPKCNQFDVDKYTKMYMSKYGIENVRGGAYLHLNMLDSTIKFVQHEISSVNDLCYKCNSARHFAQKCRSKKTTQLKKIDLKNRKCNYCRKYGHWANNCYTKLNRTLSKLEQDYSKEIYA
jgi:cellular nucleic acid-binding protein